MKKLTTMIFITAVISVFAGKKLTIYTNGGTTNYVVADIDSMKFTDIIVDDKAPAGMKLIPAKDSTFRMGVSNFNDSQQVSFTKDFYMDSTEVTQKQYDDLMTATYSGYSSPSWSERYGIGDNHPAYNVNWYDAALYCNARSKEAGRDTVYRYLSINFTPGNNCELSGLVIDLSKNGFRLPTEAEWEYACRAGTTTSFYWGNDWDDAYGWEYDNSGGVTHVVAGKSPNNFGLYDMSGNLWEWCNDWYGNYSNSAITDPTGAIHGSDRVRRGGSWYDSASCLRSGYRNDGSPGAVSMKFGFRVVCPVIK